MEAGLLFLVLSTRRIASVSSPVDKMTTVIACTDVKSRLYFYFCMEKEEWLLKILKICNIRSILVKLKIATVLNIFFIYKKTQIQR